MNTSKIVVTGMGWQTPLGDELETVWKAVLAKESGVREWSDLEKEGFRYHRAARIEQLECDPLQRGSHLAVAAISTALSNAQLASLPERTGVFVGSTMGESAAFEAKAAGANIDLHDYSCQSFARKIQDHWQLSGPALAFGTACAAGNYAIGNAADSLRQGQVEVAIAGGVDPFSKIAMAGFSRARAMSPRGECRPYDQQRSGMMLGEGAGFLILEREEEARARGVEILAEVGALGISCDAYHPTAPQPEGEGISRAVRSALKQQGLSAEVIGWICGHGSGTRASDQAEAKALAAIFGDGMRVSGSKGAFGHTLGAASALESILCVMALKEGLLPPTPGLEEQDESLPVKALSTTISHQSDYVINCAYAFGGLNTALIFGKA